MSNQNTVKNPLLDVALRIREMRQIVGYSAAEMAAKTEISQELYQEYEAGTADLPFSFMHKCAKIFGLELSELLHSLLCM